MAKTGKKQTKERGLNVRVVQEQKDSALGSVRVNSYQKKGKKRLSNEEIAQKIETTKRARKNSKKTKEESKNTKNVSQSTKTAQMTTEAIKEPPDFAGNAKFEEVKTETDNAKISLDKVEEIKPEVNHAEEKSIKAEEVKPEVNHVEEKSTKAEGVESDVKNTKLGLSDAEFETLKLGEVEKFESRIVLRDVEKEKPADALGTNIKEEKNDVKKEALPSPVRTIVYNPVVTTSKPSAKEIKEREIQKAVKTASKLDNQNKKSRRRLEFGWQRVFLAVACAATAVFAIAYFVNSTSTDMSLKVAAMQSGIEASYPSYIPRGYTLTDVTSATGKVIMHFKNGDDEFGITEESSNWDSEALLNEYIKENYGNEYTMVREQGLTLYMGGNWEAWVNGGVLYKLSVTSGSLTKKQMKSIAVSM